MSNEEMQLLNDMMELAIDGSVQEKLAELMGILKRNVDSDVRARLELLEKENAELRQYRDSAAEMEDAIANAEHNAKIARLQELLKPFTKPAWYACGQWEYIHDKCGECDEDRKIHFMSPNGKHLTENCQCAKQKYLYHVEQAEIFKMSEGDKYIWYYFSRGSSLEKAKLYKDEGFLKVYNEIPRDNRIFLDRSKAQEYVDWLNSRELEK